MSLPHLAITAIFTRLVLCIYGIHHAEPLTYEQIDRKAERRHFKSYVLDTTLKKCLSEKVNKEQAHDYRQPLQYWEYQDGHLIWGQINCLTQGFPNLKWQIGKKISSPADTAAYPSIAELGVCFAPSVQLPASGKTAIIVWAAAFGRQNKRFLKAVKEHLSKHPEIKAYFFNSDNLFKPGDF